MIGRRLKLARESAGLSLRALTERMDNVVSAQSIGRYERDVMMPDSQVLIALSRALNVPIDFLMGSSEIKLERVAFRRNKITSKKEQRQVEMATLSHLEHYLEIEEILQVANDGWNKPRKVPFPVCALIDAEDAAINMREHWGVGANPISAFAELLEEHGIKVMILDLPASVAGLACWGIGKANRHVPIIVVNSKDTGERQRFTLAHELGHMVMEISDDIDKEKASNWFAGAFLMPSDRLQSEIGQNRRALGLGELFALKELFGVSVQTIAYRCRSLEIINPTTFENLFDIFNAKGWRVPPFPEPASMPQENPKRFWRLCSRALTEGAISESKAAELLGISIQHLSQEVEYVPVP